MVWTHPKSHRRSFGRFSDFPPFPPNGFFFSTLYTHTYIRTSRQFLQKNTVSERRIPAKSKTRIPDKEIPQHKAKLWRFLTNKLVNATPQTNSTQRKLRSSAFHRYQSSWWNIRYCTDVVILVSMVSDVLIKNIEVSELRDLSQIPT